MIGIALGAAALLAVIIVGWRKARAWRQENARPGRSEATAIAITDYGEIDAVVFSQRCRCGGRFLVRGEGSRETLRIVRLECRSCEREREVYFDVRAVRH